MSGTSCDGLDISYCRFWHEDNKWHYEVLDSSSIPYEDYLREKLISCSSSNSYELKCLDIDLGKFIGTRLKKYIIKYNNKIDLISSHGHTVFHDISRGIHHQIGNPFLIYKLTNTPVVSNFRELDVIMGGQGAPLVSYGEKELFNSYDYCINIGGITNISSLQSKKLKGYDICPSNIILNHYSRILNEEFDLDGTLSKKGRFNDSLFNSLNKLEYYSKKQPKSLDLIYIEKHFYPLFENICPEDVMNTFINHIAHQINLNIKKQTKVLLTGGGVFNKHLIEKINQYNKQDINFIVPEKKLIIFKEAIIFGFLGLLRFLNKLNIDKSVTGSKLSTSSGVLINNKFF